MKSSNLMYDDLASSYDIMTQFKNKWSSQQGLWKSLVEKHSAESVLDYGCGTGFHSILLGSLGLDVLGIDLSEEMIFQSQKNLKNYAPKSNVELLKGDHLLLTKIEKQYDWILCLGNTLPHFAEERTLKEFLILCFQRLKPFGTLWIQLLNYHKILNEKKRLVGITGDDTHTFVRFYDFIDDKLNFNILQITKDQSKFTHTWLQNELTPYTWDKIKEIFAELLLYEHVEFFSDFKETPFRKDKSDNLVLLAHKLS